MSNTHRHSAWLLLAAFLAGGLLAPSVHRLQHAYDLAGQRAAERVHCRGHAHDGQSVEADLPLFTDLVCPPYHSLFSGVDLAPTYAAPFYQVSSHRSEAASHLLSVFTHRRLIRGPPLAA